MTTPEGRAGLTARLAAKGRLEPAGVRFPGAPLYQTQPKGAAMPTLVINVECADSSDLDWLRTKAVAVVEELVEDNKEEDRLDGAVEVSWDIED